MILIQKIIMEKDLTRALRAHTPRAPCICIIVQLGHMLSTTFTYTHEAGLEAHVSDISELIVQYALSMGAN